MGTANGRSGVSASEELDGDWRGRQRTGEFISKTGSRRRSGGPGMTSWIGLTGPG